MQPQCSLCSRPAERTTLRQQEKSVATAGKEQNINGQKSPYLLQLRRSPLLGSEVEETSVAEANASYNNLRPYEYNY